MTSAEKSYRDAAAKADAWSAKAEASGRIEDAATLCTLASAAKEKAGALAKADASLPPALRDDGAATSCGLSCALCGAAGRAAFGGLLCVCPNSACVRYGVPVSATVF